MIDHTAFFDELTKICAVQQPLVDESAPQQPQQPLMYENTAPLTEMPPEQRLFTADKLKRGLLAAGVVGTGAAVGHGLGELVKRHVSSLPPEKLAPYAKYGPAVAGGLMGLGSILLGMQRHRADDYIAGKLQKNPNA